MKKMFLMLAVMLLVSSAYAADVTISCAQTGSPGDGEVTVSYAATTQADTPRGMGLLIELSAGEIASVTKNTSNGYWVYPGSIVVEDANQYNGDPVAAGGVGQSSMVIEMGALHSPTGVGNGPAQSGQVIKFTVSANCDVTISADATRGGVVKYDATEADVTYTGCTIVKAEPECFPSDHPHYSQWVLVGKPSCWCFPRQCYGDADNTAEGKNKYWVSTIDIGVLRAAWNKPLTQLTGNQICADFNHNPEGKQNYRVSTADIAILRKYWQINNGPAGDCLIGPPYPTP